MNKFDSILICTMAELNIAFIGEDVINAIPRNMLYISNKILRAAIVTYPVVL